MTRTEQRKLDAAEAAANKRLNAARQRLDDAYLVGPMVMGPKEVEARQAALKAAEAAYNEAAEAAWGSYPYSTSR